MAGVAPVEGYDVWMWAAGKSGDESGLDARSGAGNVGVANDYSYLLGPGCKRWTREMDGRVWVHGRRCRFVAICSDSVEFCRRLVRFL